MFDTAGSRLNFSVVAGVEESFRVSFYSGGNGMSVLGATFQAACYVAHGYERGELVAVLPVEHDGAEHKVLLTVPELEHGHYWWELRATDAVGKVCRLLYGTLAALTSAEVARLADAAEESELRELAVEVGDGYAKPLILRWQACSAAASLAEDAARAAAEAQEAVRRLEDVESAVQEFRVFVASWKNEAASLLVMNPVTGTIWVGGMDTGEPYRGPAGEAPRINAYGFWEVFRDGQWVTLPYKAVGADGLDGSQVRRVLLGSPDELPEVEERGVLYYVPRVVRAVAGDAGVSADGEWEAWELPGEWLGGGFSRFRVPRALNANGTPVWLMVRTSAGEVLGVSRNAVTWDAGEAVVWEFAEAVRVPEGAVVQLFLRTVSEGASGAIGFEGVCMRCALGNEGVARVRYHGQWYAGRTPYFEVDLQRGYDFYVWLDPVGWVCMGGDPYGVATETSLGLLMLGTDVPVVGGAPVGLNERKQAHVPVASFTVPGVVRPSGSEVSELGGGTHMSVSGCLFADVARVDAFGTVCVSTAEVLTVGGLVGLNAAGQLLVKPATPSSLGAVMPGSFFEQLLARPYQQAVGVNAAGALANCFVPGGALQHRQPSQWRAFYDGEMPWINWEAFPDRDAVSQAHYTGLVTTGQFVQSQERGLELQAATEERLAGVFLASGGDDAREAAVLRARDVQERYMPREEVYSREEVEELLRQFVRRDWHGDVREVYLTLSEYQALKVRDPQEAYNILED